MTIQEPQVRVLIATFNGMAFLPQQISSILNQRKVKISIEVIDDGSTDGTYEYLQAQYEQGVIHKLAQLDHVGPTKVFHQLLIDSDPSDFYAFSDQDDIWLPEKIHNQVFCADVDFPTLVTCGRQLIDFNGNLIGGKLSTNLKPSWENALVENLAPGNTQLMNKKLRDLVILASKNAIQIDSWIYLISSVFAKVVIVPEPLVMYRIHSSNHIGVHNRTLDGIRKSIKTFETQTKILLATKEYKIPEDIKQSIEEHLKMYGPANGLSRIYWAVKSKAKRKTKIETYIWKLLVLLFSKN